MGVNRRSLGKGNTVAGVLNQNLNLFPRGKPHDQLDGIAEIDPPLHHAVYAVFAA
jgi:hypothetical protein